VRVGLCLLLVLLFAGCGGHRAASPEQVARAWSAALNRNDNDAAGKLFAKNAQVIQSTVTVLPDQEDAAGWNALLPCGGTILSVVRQTHDRVLVVFLLKERPQHICDGPGNRVAAVFQVEHGKIVLWHQVPPPPVSATL
jgi:limonene-1,2-epoxide hydrolase